MIILARLLFGVCAGMLLTGLMSFTEIYPPTILAIFVFGMIVTYVIELSVH